MQSFPSKQFKFPFTANRVLVAVPHPDDETAFAGTIIYYLLHSGCDVRVITLTKGECSTLRYGLKPEDDLVSARAKEMSDAMQVFGVTDYMIYDIPDGGIETHKKQTKAIMQSECETFKPDVILTLEPWGIYGHPDHIALTEIISDLTSSSEIKLGYLTVTPGYLQSASVSMAHNPELVSPIEPHIEIRLSLKDTLRKLKALKAHRSQFSITPSFIYNWYRRKLLSREYIHYADTKV